MKLLLKRFLSYFPSNLPVGLTEYEAWVDSVIELSGSYATRESMSQALANMIMHASPLKGTDTPRNRIPKNWFVKGLRKGAANQVAAYVFYEIQKKNADKKAADQANDVGGDLKQQVQDLGEVTADSKAVNEKPNLQ